MKIRLIFILLIACIASQIHGMADSNQKIFEQVNSQFKNALIEGNFEQAKILLADNLQHIRSLRPYHAYVLQLIQQTKESSDSCCAHCTKNHRKCLELLLTSEFPLSDTYRSIPSALHLAIIKGLPDIVKLLIEHDADLEEICYASAYVGMKPLQIAHQHKQNKFNCSQTLSKYEQICHMLGEKLNQK
jgi:hypothetical protein